MKAVKSMFLICLWMLLTGVKMSAAEDYSIQITEYPSIGTQTKMAADSSGQVPVVVGSPGAGQTWEFKQDLKGKEITYDYVDVLSTPYGAAVPGSDLVIKSKQWLDIDPVALILPTGIRGFFDVYYYQKSVSASNEIQGTGIGADVSPYYSGGFPFVPPSVDYAFPMQIGRKWLRKAIYSAPAKVSGLSVTLTMGDSAWKEVDAYGKLSIPSGTYDCVRIKSTRYITKKVSALGTWFPFPSDTLIMYEWFTKNAGILLQVSSRGGEKSENFTTAGYVARLSSSSVLTDVGCTPDCGPQSLAPSRCTMGQNYPNPFNPVTSIPYTLTESSRVELKVYTLLGREVAVLEAGVKPAGIYSARWNGRDASGNHMPSGVYIYRLKMTLLRNGQADFITMKMIMTD